MSLLLCACAQVVLLAPWAARILYAHLDRIRTPELEAAISLGATPFFAWREIEWPRLKPIIKNVFTFVAMLSMAESGILTLFASHGFQPLVLWITQNYQRFQIEQANLGLGFLMVFLVWSRLLGIMRWA
jgi:ABC-type Fe3+ transport system permease subunit